MVKLDDIAKEAGVSIGTVERALHNKGRIAESTKKRIIETAERMGYKPNRVAQGLAVRKKSIRLAFFYVNDTFALLQKKIAEDAREYAKGLESYGVQVDFISLDGQKPDEEIREKRIWAYFEDKIIDGFAAIGPIAAEIETILEKHGYDKVPYVSYNVRDTDESGNELCFIGCDFEKAGRLASGLVGLMLGGEGSVCVLSIDYPEISSTHLRIKGFLDGLKENYPGVQMQEILYTSPEDDFEEYLLRTEAYLDTHREIQVIYNVYTGDDDQLEKITQLGKKYQIRVVTGDLASRKQKERMLRRECAAEIAQDVAEQGHKTLETLFQYAAYGRIPKEKWIRTGLKIHLPENLILDERR